jgi:hypothetical protein
MSNSPKKTDRSKPRPDATLAPYMRERPSVDQIIAEIEESWVNKKPERESEPPPPWVETEADRAQRLVDQEGDPDDDVQDDDDDDGRDDDDLWDDPEDPDLDDEDLDDDEDHDEGGTCQQV